MSTLCYGSILMKTQWIIQLVLSKSRHLFILPCLSTQNIRFIHCIWIESLNSILQSKQQKKTCPIVLISMKLIVDRNFGRSLREKNHPSMWILVIVCMFIGCLFVFVHMAVESAIIFVWKMKIIVFLHWILLFTSSTHTCDPFNRWILNFISPFAIISAVYNFSNNELLGRAMCLFIYSCHHR